MAAFFSSPTVIFLLSLYALILVVYVLGAWISGKSVIVSTRLTGNLTNASLVYYLPMATLQIDASASVLTKTGTDGVLISAELMDISVVNTVTFVADTEFAFALNYKSSPFSADEVKFTVGATGLLDTISAATEDRLSNLISEIATAPAAILNPQLIQKEALDEPAETPLATTATMMFTKSFFIPLTEINKPQKAGWIFNIDGSTKGSGIIDASLILDFGNALASKYNAAAPTGGFDGALTRPLKTIGITITALANPSLMSTHALTVPDRESLVVVPVRRGSFIKRVDKPTFNSGLLLGNCISKPSEYEAFASIPINIAKALVSIPAQLFTFTLQNKNSDKIAELQMEKKIHDLQKAAGGLPNPPGKKT